MDMKPKRKRIVELKQYTLKELAGIYCVTRYLMRRQIKDIDAFVGKRRGYFYNAGQVETIFRLIPLPSCIEIV